MSKPTSSKLSVLFSLLSLSFSVAAQVNKNDSDLDALDLKPEPVKERPSKTQPIRLAAELVVGQSKYQYGLGQDDNQRASLDFRFAGRLAANWRAVFSDRLDYSRPSIGDRTINTLREAFVGWQDESATTTVEFGRINLRTGSGYGYNPSDFFRDGSLRTSTTLDPIALRDSRMGSVALRAQKLWSGGGLSLVVSPKLASTPDLDGLSLDLGSTNHSTRVQMGWSADLAYGVSAQILAFKQSNEGARVGGNVTALIGDSLVAHFEASHGSEINLLSRLQPSATPPSARRSASRFATGVTAALPGSLSVTAELQHNGYALSEDEWVRFASAAGPAGLGAYLQAADRLQDLASRRALLIYATKKGLGIKGLDLTGLVRMNTADRSRLVWVELRQRLGSTDVALQWQRLQGSSLSEFGVIPLRSSLQLVVTVRL
jgi:hypothetical protein